MNAMALTTVARTPHVRIHSAHTTVTVLAATKATDSLVAVLLRSFLFHF